MKRCDMARRMLAWIVAISPALLAGHALAQAPSAPWPTGAWRFGASLYLYLPSVDGNLAFPKRGGDGSVTVNTQDVFDTLNGAFMGTFDAHNGRWGVFTDFIYLDVSGSAAGTRQFQIGGRDLPASVTGNLDLGIKGVAWTIAGQYRVAATPEWTVDALAGARLLDVKPRLSWSVAGNVASIPTAGRGGSVEIEANNWDAIVGLKARYAFGDRRQWFVPLYADIGTGESNLTYQAAGGLGYAYGWGDIVGLWRYVGYEMKSGQPVNDLKFNGPVFGVVFHW